MRTASLRQAAEPFCQSLRKIALECTLESTLLSKAQASFAYHFLVLRITKFGPLVGCAQIEGLVAVLLRKPFEGCVIRDAGIRKQRYPGAVSWRRRLWLRDLDSRLRARSNSDAVYLENGRAKAPASGEHLEELLL